MQWSVRSSRNFPLSGPVDMMQTLSPGSTDFDAHYSLYNPFTTWIISEREEKVFLSGINRRVQSGHPAGWDFFEVGDDFLG